MKSPSPTSASLSSRTEENSKQVSKKQGVLVLGMHRSGTSALTRVLNLLGCALSGDLVGSGDGNEAGHWESLATVQLNDAILESAGSSWEDWGPINEDWRNSGWKAEMVGRATQIAKDHAALGPLFALKDPRLCRLADLWLEAMDAADIDPLVILMLRNPAEVAESLEARDLMAPNYAQLLWLRHVLDAEHFSRGRKRVVCRYDQLMQNWHSLIEWTKTSLGIALPRNSPAIHAKIAKFLDGNLLHYKIAADAILNDSGQSGWLRRSYAILLDWSEKGEDEADYVELDQIRQEFDHAYAAFASMLIPADLSGHAGYGSQLKRQLDAQMVASQQAAEAAQASVQEAETQLAAVIAREAELQAEIDALRAESERLGQVEAQANALLAHEAELSRVIENLQTALQSARTEAAEAAQANLQETELQLAAVNAREAELQASIGDGHLQTQNLQAEIDALRAELERLGQAEAQANALLAQEAELSREIANLQAELQSARTEAEQQRHERLIAERTNADHLAYQREEALRNAELAGRVAAAESALLQRQEELAQLWNQSLAAEKAAGVAEALVAQERERRLQAERQNAAAESTIADLRIRLEEARTAPNAVLDHLFAEIAQLTRILQEQETAADTARLAAEQETAKRNSENSQLAASLQQQEATTRAAETSRAVAEQKLATRFDEIARLTKMLADDSDRVSVADGNADWLRSLMALTQSFPKWWAIAPQRWRRRQEHSRYRRAGLFDTDRYLETYPDVAESGMDPVLHYILHGMAEGRQR